MCQPQFKAATPAHQTPQPPRHGNAGSRGLTSLLHRGRQPHPSHRLHPEPIHPCASCLTHRPQREIWKLSRNPLAANPPHSASPQVISTSLHLSNTLRLLPHFCSYLMVTLLANRHANPGILNSQYHATKGPLAGPSALESPLCHRVAQMSSRNTRLSGTRLPWALPIHLSLPPALPPPALRLGPLDTRLFSSCTASPNIPPTLIVMKLNLICFSGVSSPGCLPPLPLPVGVRRLLRDSLRILSVSVFHNRLGTCFPYQILSSL